MEVAPSYVLQQKGELADVWYVSALLLPCVWISCPSSCWVCTFFHWPNLPLNASFLFASLCSYSFHSPLNSLPSLLFSTWASSTFLSCSFQPVSITASLIIVAFGAIWHRGGTKSEGAEHIQFQNRQKYLTLTWEVTQNRRRHILELWVGFVHAGYRRKCKGCKESLYVILFHICMVGSKKRPGFWWNKRRFNK